jgi:hypothetical protein
MLLIEMDDDAVDEVDESDCCAIPIALDDGDDGIV